MEQYLIYLRKSRVDRDAENNGSVDTLERHRKALLDLARKGHYTIAKIYEEVVSGDTIAERPEMQKLLRDVETGDYAGVLVMEVERLARGRTSDQGIVADTFKYSGTRIITPARIYDPEDEADEEYFEFGLFLSRREYKTINRRLQRGKKASLSEGKYIAGTAPYGYEKTRAPGKGKTLAIVHEEAEVVRRIYDLYAHGEVQPDGTLRRLGSYTIAKKLDAEGIPSPSDGKWLPCTVRDILVNPTYCGALRWGYRPTVKNMVDGEMVERRPCRKDIDLIQGIHEPIIDRETWDQAQQIMSSRSNAPVPKNNRIKNPLAGLVYCAICGKSMVRLANKHGRDGLMCQTKDCANVSSVLEDVESGVLDALRIWLAEYKLTAKQRKLAMENRGNSRETEKEVKLLLNSLATLDKQKNKLYDYVEQELYTKEEFLERSKLLAQRTIEVQAELEATQKRLEANRALEEQQNVIIPKIEQVLDVYTTLTDPKEKNDLLKEVVERVTYFKTTGGRWGKNNMELKVLPKLGK